MFSLVLATSGSLVRVGLANCVRRPARGAERPEADSDLSELDSSGLSLHASRVIISMLGQLEKFLRGQILGN
jgi:hypothetical protein